MPEANVSLQYTYAEVKSLSLACSPSESLVTNVMQLYELSDRFGNWLRTPSLSDAFQACA